MHWQSSKGTRAHKLEPVTSPHSVKHDFNLDVRPRTPSKVEEYGNKLDFPASPKVCMIVAVCGAIA